MATDVEVINSLMPRARIESLDNVFEIFNSHIHSWFM